MMIEANLLVLALSLFILVLIAIIRKKYPPDKTSFYVTRVPKSFAHVSYKVKCAKAIPWLFWTSILCALIALSNPVITRSFEKGEMIGEYVPREGLGLYYLLDQSGSMKESVDVGSRRLPKIDLAKQAIRQDLQERRDDLVGLVAFARAAQILCPLTLDHHLLLERLKMIEPIEKESQNGTAIGYAIFKTVNIFVATNYFAKRQEENKQEAYAIQRYVLVVITDGLQSPHPEDRQNPFRFIPIDEAVRFAKENGVVVYFIGIDPVFKRPDFRNQVDDIKSAVESTGGRFFLTSQLMSIENVLSEIKTIERKALPQKVIRAQDITKHPLALFFIGAALFFLALGMVFETLICRRIP